tara:strand:+ start:152 stop:451 length:300 start_codon:yes stop_codon:yes gene_type:complete
MFEELSEQYGQFIVMALVFLVGAAVYGGYLYYKKQEDIKKVNNNLQRISQNQTQQNTQQKPPPPQQKSPEFVPSKEFKGEQKGYTFKNGDKGQGYYMDK